MAGWDFASNEGSGSKAEYTKFPEGITRIRIVGIEPHSRWVHWLNAHKKSVNCPGTGCAICEVRRRQRDNKEDPSYNMSRRFAIWVLNRETEKLEIMEQGITFFEDLRDVMEELGDNGKMLQEVDLKIKRKGEKTNTTYRISIGDESPLTDSDKKLMEGMFVISEYMKPITIEQSIAITQGSTWEEVMDMNKPEEDVEEIKLK